MTEKLSIGIDCGCTNIKGGIVDRDGRVIARSSLEIAGATEALDVVTLVARLMRELAGSRPLADFSIGCGFPGIVDHERGRVLSSPNFPKWRDVPIRDLLAEIIQLSPAIDNDANLHAIGEQRFGAGQGRKNLVFLTLGTGIGGGIIIDGELFRGDSGFAGEIGHMIIEEGGELCGCGRRGCFERYGASHAFELFIRRMDLKERTAYLAKAGSSIEGVTPAIVARLADSGCEQSLKMWKEFGRNLGRGIAMVMNVLGIESFVIGGGIARSFDLFAPAVRIEIQNGTYKENAERIQFLPAVLGEDAGIIGAAVIGHK